MKSFKPRDIYTFICTTAAIITSGIIILTFLTTYHFINTMPIYNSYLPLQIGICITMTLWSIRFLLNKKGREKYYYSLICFIICIICLFFILNSVI